MYARRTDPASSHDAARRATRNGSRQTQKSEVMTWVLWVPGSTSAEIAQMMSVTRDIPARRLSELADDGRVKHGPMRKCEISGRSVVTWWPFLAKLQGELFSDHR